MPAAPGGPAIGKSPNQYPDVHLQPGYQFELRGTTNGSLGLIIELPVFEVKNQGPIGRKPRGANAKKLAPGF